MGFNKKFFTTGGIVASSPSAAPFDPLQNFETVTYTGNGSTQKITGYIRKGAAFNGSSSKIVVSDSSTIFDAAGGFSASVWVNRNTTANQTILNKEGGVSGSYGWSLRFTSGLGYSYDVYDTSNNQVTVSTGANSTTGNWENIVISFNNSDNKLRIYFDGGTAVVSSALPSAASSNTENFFIGARTTSAIFTDGKIDQVRIYSAAITDAQAEDCYTDETTTTAATLDFPAGAGCIAAYQLDGNGNDVGLTTTTTLATYQLDNATTSIPNNTYPGTESNITYTTGKFGDAAVFNGSSSKIDITGQLPTSTTSDYAISTWVNADNLGSAGRVIFSNLGAGGSFGTGQAGIYIWNSKLRFYIYSGSGSSFHVYDGSSTISTGTWYNIVSNIDINAGTSTSLIAYINGSPETLTFLASTNMSGNSLTQFGVAQNTHFWDGKIDQVRIFDIALPQAAATALYNETTTTATSPSISYSTYPGTTTDIGYTGLKFTPDLTWIKILDQPYDNNLYDTVRGADGQSGAADKVLTSNKALAQEQGLGDVTIQTNAVKVVETVGSPSSSEVNKNGDDFVSWNFKAGGAPTATNSAGAGNVPTSGSVMIDGVASTTALAGTTAATKISANTAAGFSIVEYSGNSTAGATVAHGLTSPQMIMIKCISTDATNWIVYVDPLGNSNYLSLNDALSQATFTNWFYSNATTFTLNQTFGNANTSGRDYVAYCFSNINEYQKIGSYTGTALSNNFVQTDFTPSFVLIKSSSLTSTNWVIIDSKRSSGTLWLYPNTSDDEEGPYTNTALNSNGFTVDGNSSYVNSSGETYIYLAIAQ